MKSLLPIALMLLTAAPSIPQKNPESLGLPELHKINKITLAPSYSCASEADFAKGYGNSALYLSAYSKRINAPELLFDGACKSPDYFSAATAGDFLDVIADFGDVRLEDLIAADVFGPRSSVDSTAPFRYKVKTQLGHTYCVLINKGMTRGFFYFKVVGYVPNQKLDLEYVVMDYSLIQEQNRTPGFDWERKSFY
jgi:hypothetical protein